MGHAAGVSGVKNAKVKKERNKPINAGSSPEEGGGDYVRGGSWWCCQREKQERH